MNNKAKAILGMLSLCLVSNVAAKERFTLYAASSLTNVINELVEHYEESHDVDIVPVYAGSSALARQIEHGAPADVYISANQKWAEYLIKKMDISQANVANLVSNSLVMIASNELKIDIKKDNYTEWLTLLGDNRLAIGQPDSVPAGIYAKQALQNIGMWDALSNKLAPTNNVRSTLTLVERNETPLGIVYKTDANVSDKVQILYEFQDGSHDPITYPMLTLKPTKMTTEFANYLLSEEAKDIFIQYGFN